MTDVDLAVERALQARALRDLRAAGFTEAQAWSLARVGYGVVEVVPLGQARLPIDEHLSRIGATS